jgi:hypothetical protein
MNWRDAILRMMGVVAFAAALFVAPSMAQAHGNHSHHEHAAAAVSHDHAGYAHHAHAKAAVAVVAAADTDTSDRLQAVALQEMTATPADSDSSTCDGRNCCTTGHCSACVSAVLSPPVVALPPVARRMVLRTVSPDLASATPDGLRRPPKSFV